MRPAAWLPIGRRNVWHHQDKNLVQEGKVNPLLYSQLTKPNRREPGEEKSGTGWLNYFKLPVNYNRVCLSLLTAGLPITANKMSHLRYTNGLAQCLEDADN